MSKGLVKALSIKQPYLDWIRTGVKQYEVRSWKTKYRGPLILCSSKKPEKFFSTALPSRLGKALCLVELVDVKPFLPEHERRAACQWKRNHFIWELKFVANIEAFPVNGKLGIFNLT